MNLSYTESGSLSALPLVLIHAFPLSRQMWKHQHTALADTARVLSVDLPGFGESDSLSVHPSIQGFTDAVVRFLDEKGIDRAVIVGCSMGGYIAFELWRRAQERVAGMVLCDTKAEADTPEARQVRMDAIEGVKSNGVGPVAEAMVPKLLGQSSHERHPELASEIDTIIRDTKPEAIIHAQQAMADRPNSIETLSSISVPVLMLFGDEDAITPPSFGQTMSEHLPQCTLTVIPFAGHLSPLEQPDSVNEAIKVYLASLS